VDHRIGVLAARQHGVFTCAQVLAQGATRKQIAHRIKTGRWAADAPGLYVIAGSPRTWRQRVLAAVLAAGGGAAASHRTAAALWGLPGFSEDVVELSRLEGRSYRSSLARVRRTGLLPEHHILECDGIRTTTPARTIFDLAGAVHPKRPERALDNALARKILSLERLRATHRELAEHGRAGSALVREMLEARGVGYVAPESGLEAHFIDLAMRCGLPEPARQVWLGDHTRLIGRVDFCYREHRIVVEIDSDRHHRTLLDRTSDQRRDQLLGAAGWRVVRITEDVLRDRPTDGLEMIERLLAEAA